MSIVSLLVPLATLLGLSFGAAFVWMALRGQFDELDSPAHRILFDDTPVFNQLYEALTTQGVRDTRESPEKGRQQDELHR